MKKDFNTAWKGDQNKMKIYFYGGTEKAAKKKMGTFLKQLDKFNTDERTINVTNKSKVEFIGSPEFPIPSGHSCQVSCEYSWMAK